MLSSNLDPHHTLDTGSEVNGAAVASDDANGVRKAMLAAARVWN